MMERLREKTALYVVRMILVSLCLVGILFLDHSTSFVSKAYTQTTGKVTAASAKIRAEANTTSTALGSVVSNDTLTITDEVTGADGYVWYQVFVDANVKGYIRSDLVSKSGSTAATTTSTTTTTTATPAATATVTAMDSKTAYVTTASVRVRSDASTTAAVLASVGKGVEVTVSGSAKGTDGNTWYQVSFTYSGTTVKGFIRSDFLSFDALPEEAPAVTEVVGTTTTGAGDTAAETTGETTGETTDGTDTAATDAAAQETTEAEQATEETTQQTAAEEPASTIVLMNVDEEPVLPAGYEEISLNWNEETIRAWKNGDFYIFYAVTEKGNSSWVRYDSVEETYQRYIADTTADGFFGSAKTQTIIIVTLIVVVLLLIVLAALLYIKNKNLLSEIDWDDEEEEDNQEEVPAKAPKKSWRALNFMSSDNDYEDEDDDDEDEEEEEPVIRRPQQNQPVNRSVSQNENRNRQVQRPVQSSGPVQGERPVQGARPTQGARPVQTSRTVQTDRPVQTSRPVQGERPVQANRPVAGQNPRPANNQGDGNGQRVVVRRPVSQENNGAIQNQSGQRVVVRRPVSRPQQNMGTRADEIDFIDIDALD